MLAVAVFCGLASGGCSMSYKMFDKAKADTTEITGSIPSSPPHAMAADLTESDLALARAAAADLLGRNTKDASQPWENPSTGARGMVTPVAASYSEGGLTCRDFLASHVVDKSETWLQGEACQSGRGTWEVRSLRPWKRT